MTIKELKALPKWINPLNQWALLIEIAPEKLKKRVRNCRRDENSRFIHFYVNNTFLRFDFEKFDDGFRVLCFNRNTEEYFKSFPVQWLVPFFKTRG